VPTVLKKEYLHFVIYTDDHKSMPTPVKKAGREVIINLGGEKIRPSIREIKRMSKANALAAA
jgi:hypothetical protein